MKTSLIIPAAGFGKRLEKYIYPKVLLPVYNISIIEQIVKFWEPNEVIIVLKPENINIVKKYTENKYVYLEENRKGSAFAVQTGILASNYDNIILNWCDILPLKKPNSLENFCFVSKNIKCSYNGKNGGIYGVFTFNKNNIEYPIEIIQKDKEVIILDVIDIKLFKEIEIPAIDIGDSKKYTVLKRSCDNPVRSFNKIIINDNNVIKICNDDRLKKSEENWYKKMSKFDFIPNIISYNPLKMQRVFGEKKYNKVKPLYDLAKKIHNSYKPIKASEKDCIDVYINKSIKRLKEIEYLLNFKDKFIVNNILCENPINILKSVNINDLIPKYFTPIHGDLTTSNVLWQDNKPYVIDPRGIFGNSLFYGDPDYDIAKIYYSTTNWHLLNMGKLSPKVISDNKFEVKNIKLFGTKKIDFLLASIWLSVTSYVKNNVLSVAYAYFMGSLLLQKWINTYKG